MARETINLSRGTRNVTLNDEEVAELQALQAERDEALKTYYAHWEELFERACKRANVYEVVTK